MENTYEDNSGHMALPAKQMYQLPPLEQRSPWVQLYSTVKGHRLVEFSFDMDCELCAKGLAKLDELQKRHEGAYGNRWIKNGRRVGSVTLTPDYNSCGHCTHFHIQ
jgi:hypothetical protein